MGVCPLSNAHTHAQRMVPEQWASNWAAHAVWDQLALQSARCAARQRVPHNFERVEWWMDARNTNKDKAQDRRVSYGIIVSGAALNVEDHSPETVEDPSPGPLLPGHPRPSEPSSAVVETPTDSMHDKDTDASLEECPLQTATLGLVITLPDQASISCATIESSGAPAPTEVSPALLIDQLHCVEDKEAKPVPAQLEEGQHMDLVSLFFGLPTIFTTLSVSS